MSFHDLSRAGEPDRPTRPSLGAGGGDHAVSTAAVAAAAAALPGGPDRRTSAVLEFLAGWRQRQHGDITAGGSLLVQYEPARLHAAAPDGGDADWSIVGYARFLPGGQVRHVSLFGGVAEPAAPPADGSAERPEALAAEIRVPPETREVELWFQRTDGAGESWWDSRFGENYRYRVVHPAPSGAQALQPRPGASTDPALIGIVDDAAVKENLFASRPGYPAGRTNLQTRLHVAARVAPGASVARVWVDLHVFERSAALVHAETRPLEPAGTLADGAALYASDAVLYQGAVATPGSVMPKPDVRTVHYRLYAEADGRLVTDGVLHQCELAADPLSG